MLTLSSKIKELSRVGEATAKRLAGIGIETVGDLLFYFPYRYEDFREITPINRLRRDTSANIAGRIELIQSRSAKRRRMNITEALIADDTGTLKAIWFNQPFIARTLKMGDLVSLTGKVELDFSGLAMKSPAYEKIADRTALRPQGLVPVYHLTANITNKQIRYLASQALKSAYLAPEILPADIRKRNKLDEIQVALIKIHAPKEFVDIESARRRFAFGELFMLQLKIQLIKKELDQSRAASVRFKKEETKKFVSNLPFILTDAQKKAAWAILGDMEKERPMSRMLAGDVGSGKTVVAAIAMLNAALGGRQSVIMVPTEILARQHFESFSKLLDGFGVNIAILTRTDQRLNYKIEPDKKKKGKIAESKKKISKKDVIGQIKSGSAQIIIGTHALIQEKAGFKDLALAVIDEQHRFGVAQRKALMEKAGANGMAPHLMSMTATPIPRSLALALYGDLDISRINEMPVGRKKILTKTVPEEKRMKAYEFIRSEIAKGRQVFVICPLIDISDKLGAASAKEEYKKLNESVFPDLKIGILHGKLRSAEKAETMENFLKNEINILVSTSVVEVGVDIPNASIMMIEGADRFGLSQLHQFRGRVGRSEHQSYCFLFTENDNPRTLERLRALEENHDGFELAKIDLKFRGPGEVYGLEQKGFPELKVASIFDYELMQAASEEAEKLIASDPELAGYPQLKEKIGTTEEAHLE
jgi:ATP-dependent DNA helicase RecG